MTKAVMPLPSEARPRSGPHAGEGGLLLLADGVGIDRRSFNQGVTHPLREHMEGDTLVHGMHGVPWRRSLGTRWAPSVMSAYFMMATTRRQVIVRDQDPKG